MVLGYAEVQQASPSRRDIGLCGGYREHRRIIEGLCASPRERRHVDSTEAHTEGIPVVWREQNEGLADVGCGVASAGFSPIDDSCKDPVMREDMMTSEIEVGPRHRRAGERRSTVVDSASHVDVYPPRRAVGAALKGMEPVLKS